MTNTELPDTMEDRVAWVISAPNNAELRRRYDLWAKNYDADIGDVEDYLGLRETADVAQRFLATDARIMDAGSGTGLSGEALYAVGFNNLVGEDTGTDNKED